jgi:CheY-like chemotaxis protein
MNVHEILEHVLQLSRVSRPGSAWCCCATTTPACPRSAAIARSLSRPCSTSCAMRLEATGEQPRCEITLRTRSQRQFTIGSKRATAWYAASTSPTTVRASPRNSARTLFMPMVSGRAEGTGLGLSIAQGIVHRHGGLLTCEAAPGDTCFSIYLPMDTPDHAEVPRIRMGRRRRPVDTLGAGASPVPGGHPAGSALARRRIHAAPASREQPDVVISDIRMPGIDGLELLRASASSTRTCR